MFLLRSAIQTHIKSISTQTYVSLPRDLKRAYLPRTQISPLEFLRKIGRDAEKMADKFKSFEHLMTSDTRNLNKMGIKPKLRKYILSSIERYKRGDELLYAPIRPRQMKYKLRKQKVEHMRNMKIGLA